MIDCPRHLPDQALDAFGQFYSQPENLNLEKVFCLPGDDCEGKHMLGCRIS